MAQQELRKDGFDFAESRYKELKPILDEVTPGPPFQILKVSCM